METPTPVPTTTPTATTSATTVHTTTKTLVGIALLTTGLLAAAAGFVVASNRPDAVLSVRLSNSVASHASETGKADETMLGVVLQAMNDNVTVNRLMFSTTADTDGSFTTVENTVVARDHISLCSLKNAQGATIGQGQIIDNLGNVSFTSLNLRVNRNTSMVLKLNCSLSASPVDGGTPDIYAFSINNDAAVDAVNSRNVSLAANRKQIETTADIGVNANRTVAITVSDVVVPVSAALSVSVAANTPAADFILTSSNTNHVATYRFDAITEPFTIQTLEFTEEQAEDDTGTADSAAYTNNIALVSISYPKADGSTGTAMSATSGNVARFTGLSMYVPVGTAKDVKVFVNVPATDRDATGLATSNEKIRMAFSDGDNTGSESFKATGANTGMAIDEAAPGIVDIGDDQLSTDGVATFVVREAKPVITLSPSSPSGSSVAGRGEVIRFNVAASANEDTVINSLMFSISSTNNSGSVPAWNQCDNDNAGGITLEDFDLYNLTINGMSDSLDAGSTWTLFKPSGAPCDNTAADVKFARIAFGTPQIVAKGSTYTYALYFDSTGASSAFDDSIRFDLPVDPIVSTFLPGAVINDTSLTWSDSTITLQQSGSFRIGDVVCFAGTNTACDPGEEKGFVTAVSGNNITLARGYMGSSISQLVNGHRVMRLPGSLLWQDDGIGSVTTSQQEYWGSYLVDNLTVNGGTLVF